MKMSTKARYGLYSTVLLAKSYQKETVSVSEIASSIGIGEKYIEQIMSILKKKGIVIAQRGNKGGYALADDPQNISVGQILRSCENDLIIVDCISRGCKGKPTCTAHKLFTNLYKHINGYLDKISLKELIEESYEDIS